MEESSNWRFKCGRDWAQRVDMGLQCEYGAIASVIWAADPASHGHIEKVSAIFFFCTVLRVTVSLMKTLVKN